MKIRTISLNSFMLLDQVELTLPARGIVLVTGANGEGKSTLIESVPAGLWNKTLRGTPWWREDAESSVSLGIYDTVQIERTRTGSKNKLTLAGMESFGEFDTAAKAQVLLDRIIPSFDVWKKTSVFSSSAIEGDHFTSGGDGDRKRLLEAVLAIDKFDRALDLCRVDMKRNAEMIARRTHDYEIEHAKMQAEDRRREEASTRVKEIKVGDRPAAEKAKELAETLSKLTPEVEELRVQERKLDLKHNKLEGELRGAKAKLDLLMGGHCPTCAQTVPVEMIEGMRATVYALQSAIEIAKGTSAEDLDAIRQQLEELRETVRELESQRRSVIDHAKSHDALLAEKNKLEAILREAVGASARHLARRSEANRDRTKATSEVAILSKVEHVLGLKGVRAHVLAHTLAGLAQVTNKWLAKMDSALTIALSPYTEKKGGGTSDSIGIKVTGAGAGHGYSACSTGQRRRLDVALLLGLATLAQAAHGLTDSTLFFDEVFESLDQTGVRGVVAALRELSSDRCVVVVSHSDHLRRALEAEKHFHVEKGQVTEL